MMLSLSFLLFIVIDPFGNLFAIETLLREESVTTRRKVIVRECFAAAIILILASLVGGALLELLALEPYSLQISGGIILFLIALDMLFPGRGMSADQVDGLPFLVPIAMPLIAGPSAISMVVLFSQSNSFLLVSGAITVAISSSLLLLIVGNEIFKFLGQRGAIALERLLGMLLVLISVQMTLDGVSEYISAKS